MAFDPSVYGITIARREIEGESLFEATIRELPDVKEYGDSYEEAYELALDSIQGLHDAAQEEGWAFPPPVVGDHEYSGRVTLRMAKSLHRAVALRAEGEGVSLNSHICNVIAKEETAGRTPKYSKYTRHAPDDTRRVGYASDYWRTVTLLSDSESNRPRSPVSAVHEPRTSFEIFSGTETRQ